MLNSVIIIGRLTREPEIRTTLSGKRLCRFGIANDTGTKEKPEVNFFDVTAWGERGDFIERYFRKGDPIIINGKLRQVEYTGKDGQTRKSVEIVAAQVDFVPGYKKQGITEDADAQTDNADELPFEL